MDVPRETNGLVEHGPKIHLAAQIEGLRGKVIALLVQHRQTVFLGIIVLIVLVEVSEHLLGARFGEQAGRWITPVFYTLLIPVGVWLVLGLLEKTEKEREQVTQENNISSELTQKLEEARSWEELAALIVRCPALFVPVEKVTLYLLRPGSSRLEPEAQCDREGRVVMKPDISDQPDTLPLGSLPQLLLQNGGTPAGGPTLRYDLIVARSDQQIGIIKLEFAREAPPSQAGMRKLKELLPVVALALEVSLLQELAAEQAATSQSQRQQIAQNLHDTLAQNISYLRLKLDQITGENAIREIGVVLQELEQMRATADEAYQQVRNTLEALNPLPAEDLTGQISKQAEIIGQRSGFSIQIQQLGCPYFLPPALRQQILYIAREALHNVEKHARATRALLQFVWLENELVMKICDDGVGFDPRSMVADGHYGLWIMQHRAQEIGGMLKVSPGEKQGTEVTLWVPRLRRSPEQAVGPAVEQHRSINADLNRG